VCCHEDHSRLIPFCDDALSLGPDPGGEHRSLRRWPAGAAHRLAVARDRISAFGLPATRRRHRGVAASGSSATGTGPARLARGPAAAGSGPGVRSRRSHGRRAGRCDRAIAAKYQSPTERATGTRHAASQHLIGPAAWPPALAGRAIPRLVRPVPGPTHRRTAVAQVACPAAGSADVATAFTSSADDHLMIALATKRIPLHLLLARCREMT
jgi:hypothetical protein